MKWLIAKLLLVAENVLPPVADLLADQLRDALEKRRLRREAPKA